jgi:hypothetical protein
MLFQNALIYQLGDSIIAVVISYLDEIVALLALFYLLYCWVSKRKLNRLDKKMLICISLINLIGTVSSIAYRNNTAFPTVEDAFNCNKFIIIYLSTILYAEKTRNSGQIIIKLNRPIRFITVILTILTLTNYLTHFFPTHGARYGLDVQKLFFAHPNDFAYVGLVCIIILLYNQKSKNNFPYMIMCSIMVLTTMRIRMVAMIVVIWAAYYYFIALKLKSKVLISVIVAVIVLLVGYDQIATYYGNSLETRSIVTVQSFSLANQCFPLGLGFGTYGTNMARQYYSPVYRSLGFNAIWGLNAENDTFLTDQFWPAVIGQFGWIGLVLFIIFILALFRRISRMQRTDIYLYTTAIILFVYEIFTSLGETAYYNPLAVLIFFLLGLCIADSEKGTVMENRI